MLWKKRIHLTCGNEDLDKAVTRGIELLACMSSSTLVTIVWQECNIEHHFLGGLPRRKKDHNWYIPISVVPLRQSFLVVTTNKHIVTFVNDSTVLLKEHGFICYVEKVSVQGISNGRRKIKRKLKGV